MKILHFITIIVSVFFISLLTSHVYAQCNIVNGTQTCLGMNPILNSIKSDRSLYENSDKPVITITGVPHSLEYLEINNQSGNMVFSHSIELPSTGIANYTLDISSYKLGIYSAIAHASTSTVSTTFTVGQILSSAIMSAIDSPLQQFKSGTPASDVKCADGFTLVIKAEDISPACVTPDTAQKLIERGWAREIVQSVKLTNHSTCDGTHVPAGDFRKQIFPVLMMQPNSTAIVCVTYNFETDWQSYHNKDVYPDGILEVWRFVHPGWYSEPLLSDKFESVANPPLVNVTGVTNGSKISVTYKLYANPDSKGFYDTSVPFGSCLSYPLAVGYDPSEVDATKFHNNFAIPCFATIEDVYSVNIISGMTYKEVQFP